jgi:hypothetical protein
LCTAVTSSPASGSAGQFRDEVGDRPRGARGPAVRHHRPVAHIRGQDDAARREQRLLREPRWILDPARAHHHPVGAVADQRGERLVIAHAAADLHGHGGVPQDVAHELAVVPGPGGRVEIHHMQA